MLHYVCPTPTALSGATHPFDQQDAAGTTGTAGLLEMCQSGGLLELADLQRSASTTQPGSLSSGWQGPLKDPFALPFALRSAPS